MKNISRHPDYFKIKQRIKSCPKIEALERLREVVLRFNSENKVDGPELLVYFLEKEQDLSVEYKNEQVFLKRNEEKYFDYENDSMESLDHQARLGGHSTY